MLNLIDISISYKENVVLEHINLKFENGIYGLLSPNGEGKTTLLKIITTLLFPDNGKILYNGQDIYKLDERYRELLGFLPQDFGYYKDYTVYKFLKYIGVLKGIVNNKLELKIDEVLDIVELKKEKHIKMKNLSGGMKQRVGLAQSLLNDPKLLILDEPTASLDISQRVAFKSVLSKIALNAIVIVSTHIVSDIESIANEFILIKDKSIYFKGELKDLLDKHKNIVWSERIKEQDLENIESNYYLINKKLDGDKINVRYLSRDIPSSNANSVEANLEDIFLYIYNYKEKRGLKNEGV